MINEEDREEWIEQYLERKLTGEALEEFEGKKASDAAFCREIALQQKIVRNIQHIGRERLRMQLKVIHQHMVGYPTENDGKAAILPKNDTNYYTIAAILILLIASKFGFVLVYRIPDKSMLAILPVEIIGSTETTRSSTEMINVAIFPPADALDFHYHFTDTLNLYGPFDAKEIRLYYNMHTHEYLLEHQKKWYVLRKNQSVIRLEEKV